MVIANNIWAMNAQRQLKVNTSAKAKKTEKLSSGYRINRAADDAASLCISEKMRSMIRSLNRGTENAQDGISWVQIGDGALTEAHDILHRMNELSIKSLNGTNSESDRNAMQEEFGQLQNELDRISTTTQFNTKMIFLEKDPTYSQIKGNKEWPNLPKHVITDGKNELSITFTPKSPAIEVTEIITIPAGEYTTQELSDEIDDALFQKGLTKKGLTFEYGQDGLCNINLSGSSKLASVGGSLSYLLHDSFSGGSVGALIGTTYFESAKSKLDIVAGKNDNLQFTVQDMDGNESEMNITLSPGQYTREKLIDALNEKIVGQDIKATAYGNGIKLAGEDSIITGFKGNMFQIDSGSKIYHSVFYDNVKYGNVVMSKSYLEGGLVLNTDDRDVEHNSFNITDANNTLTFTPNGADSPTNIVIPNGSYTAEEMKDKLNELFTINGLDLLAERTTGLINGISHEGLKITSEVIGNDSNVGLDKTSSAYSTLFTKQSYNTFTRPGYSRPYYGATSENAIVYGNKDVTYPLTVTAGSNDAFNVVIARNGVSTTNKVTIESKRE